MNIDKLARLARCDNPTIGDLADCWAMKKMCPIANATIYKKDMGIVWMLLLCGFIMLLATLYLTTHGHSIYPTAIFSISHFIASWFAFQINKRKRDYRNTIRLCFAFKDY